MEITGIINKVLPIVTGQGKKGTWSKQEFIIQTEGQYPKNICISLWGEEKINKYDLQHGLKVTAFIELESREHNGRWFTEVRAWKIEWDKDARKWTPGGESKPEPARQESNSSQSDDFPF